MNIKVNKNINEYSMATINYKDKFFVLPWEDVKRECGVEDIECINITYCVHKNKVCFVLVYEDNSYVIVYNVESGIIEYITEGFGVIKAVCVDDTVYAAVKIEMKYNVIHICKGESEIGSYVWKYEDLGIVKAKDTHDEDDYLIFMDKDQVMIRVNNAINKGKYKKFLQDSYSKYCYYDYWKNLDIGCSEGEISKDSLFIEYFTGDENPGKLRYANVTHCNCVKFAAGYLKYLVLADAAHMVFFIDDDSDDMPYEDLGLEQDEAPNIDYILDRCNRNSRDKYNLLSVFMDMVDRCDSILLNNNEKDALQMLIETVKICNDYFKNEIFPKSSFRFGFNIYHGANEAKEMFLKNATSIEDKIRVQEIFEKEQWNNVDCEIVSEIIKNII